MYQTPEALDHSLFIQKILIHFFYVQDPLPGTLERSKDESDTNALSSKKLMIVESVLRLFFQWQDLVFKTNTKIKNVKKQTSIHLKPSQPCKTIIVELKKKRQEKKEKDLEIIESNKSSLWLNGLTTQGRYLKWFQNYEQIKLTFLPPREGNQNY